MYIITKVDVVGGKENLMKMQVNIDFIANNDYNKSTVDANAIKSVTLFDLNSERYRYVTFSELLDLGSNVIGLGRSAFFVSITVISVQAWNLSKHLSFKCKCAETDRSSYEELRKNGEYPYFDSMSDNNVFILVNTMFATMSFFICDVILHSLTNNTKIVLTTNEIILLGRFNGFVFSIDDKAWFSKFLLMLRR